MTTIPLDVEQQFKTKMEDWDKKFPCVKPYYILEYNFTENGYTYTHLYDAADVRACYLRIQELHPDSKFIQLKVVAKIKGHSEIVRGSNSSVKSLRAHRVPPSTLAFPFSPQTLGLILQ